MIDAYASEYHYHQHVQAVIDAVPEPYRGCVYTPDTRQHLSAVGGPILLSSYYDLVRLRGKIRRPLVLMEHGCGQTYSGAGETYADSEDRRGCAAYLAPGPWAAGRHRLHHPRTPVHEVGMVLLEEYLQIRNAYERTGPPVVAFGWHWDCVPSGVLVSAPAVRARCARRYNGQLCVIRTASGNDLAVTPNHPILTRRGWVAAQFIQEGDHVVSCINPEGLTRAFSPNEYQIPTPIEEVTCSTLSTSSVVTRTVPVSSLDFHGDGADSQVCIVSSNGLLRGGGNPSSYQPVCENTLLRGNLYTPGLPSLSTERQFLLRSGGALHSTMGRRDQSQPTFSAQVSHPAFTRTQGVHFKTKTAKCLIQSSWVNAQVISQNTHPLTGFIPAKCLLSLFSSNRELGNAIGILIPQEVSRTEFCEETSTAYTKFMRDLPDGASGFVRLDCVIETTTRTYSGFVHNLSTPTGWYIAGGIVTHNCSLVRETCATWHRWVSQLTKIPYRVLGHGHPRELEKIRPEYTARGIPIADTFREVVERADVYCVDNSRTAFEALAVGIPVVLLDNPDGSWARAKHGLRFGAAGGLFPRCDDPRKLASTIDTAIQVGLARRDAILDYVYSPRTGGAAAAAHALVGLLR